LASSLDVTHIDAKEPHAVHQQFHIRLCRIVIAREKKHATATFALGIVRKRHVKQVIKRFHKTRSRHHLGNDGR